MSMIRVPLFENPSLETTARGTKRLIHAASPLPRGASVNIAFIGSESCGDRIAAIDLLLSSGVFPRPIVSARRLESKDVLRSFLYQAVQLRGVRSIFLVGGDPSRPKGPFKDSLDVITGRFLDMTGIETVGIAGYPEGHPAISDEVLSESLRRKVGALTSRGLRVEITTQLSFDSSAVITWIERVRRMGIDAPIRVGIPSPATVHRMLEFARRCHVKTSAHLLQRCGWNVAPFLKSAGSDQFLADLLKSTDHSDLGPVHLHLYPLGDLSKALQWLRASEERWSRKAYRLH